MDRSEILEMMAALQLSGMRAAYDEILATGIKRKHSIEHIIGALLKQELAEKHARSIRYQMGIAKMPLAKELADFAFKDTPINEQLVRDLASANFLAQQRNVVAVGGTGTGKSHLAIGITRSCIRLGRKARYFNAVDLRPAAVPSDQPALRAHVHHRHDQPGLRRMAERVLRCQDDDGAPRPAHPPLRHHRDRQRELALQEPRLIGAPDLP